MDKQRLFQLIVTFVLILFIGVPNCHALVNRALYTIENIGSKQCISAGGVVKKLSDPINPAISPFKNGRPLTKPCSNTSSLETIDFSQQWMVRILRENPRTATYQVHLGMINAVYNDTGLTMMLRGEFIMYFPDRMKLKAAGPLDEASQSQVFYIRDLTSRHCLTENGKTTHFVGCERDNDFQKWNFILVNEKLLDRRPSNMSTSSLH